MRAGLGRIKRLYRYIPTSLTIGNVLCGFTAILHALTAYDPGVDVGKLLAGSAWLVIFAMIFDMLDGWTARLLHAISEHGMEMDSLADMTTFGVAPAVIVAVMAHSNEIAWLDYRFVWFLCAVYIACAALRLALYNVTARDPEKQNGGFHGLPSPGAAAAVCSLLLLYGKRDYEFVILANLLPVYAAILGLLMVSPIPYIHVGKLLGSRHHYRLKILALIIFSVLFARNPATVAAVVINLYVFSGPFQALLEWVTAGDSSAEEAQAEDKVDEVNKL